MTLTWKSGSVREKIPISELAEALDILGIEGKSMVITYLLASDQTKTPPGHIELSIVEEVLQSLFGDGSQILLSIIQNDKCRSSE
jgi:hypothetical protein